MNHSSEPTQSDFLEQHSWSGDPFASDPFASTEFLSQNSARPVVEIVENLGGYRQPESPEITQVQIVTSETNPMTSEENGATHQSDFAASTSQNWKPAKELALSEPRFRVSSLGQIRKLFGSTICSLEASTSKETDTAATTNLCLASSQSSEKSWYGDGTTRFIAKGISWNEPPIDIRDFAIEESSVEQEEPKAPEPIPGCFQLEHDFFEFNAAQRYLSHLEELDREISELVAGRQGAVELNFSRRESPKAVADLSTEEHPGSTETTAQVTDDSDDMAGVIYAGDRQVIFVDGSDGYQYIDLTCFDIKQASFQGNRIHIRNGTQEFEIDYRNITHVLFANDQEVELASSDEDYF